MLVYKRKLMRVLVFILLLGCYANTYAMDNEPNLCESDEAILFSCATGTKVLSVCATKSLSKSEGKLTYRFGESKQTVELAYSENYNSLEEKFNYSYSGYPKGAVSELSFSIGQYLYTVHADTHVFKDSSAGVFIERQGEIIAYKACNNAYQKNNLYSISKAGFNTSEARGIGTKPD